MGVQGAPPEGVAPVLIVGAGRMGGAVAEGLVRAGALAPADLAFRAPRPREAAQALIARGAGSNPQDLSRFATVVLAVKPQVWREVAAELAPSLSHEAVLVSVVAGVRLAELTAAFEGRACVRVMPTTGVAAADGVATVFGADAGARARGLALFDPIATTVALDAEDQMDAATAVSGSAPAYLYAFMEALEAAGEQAGLPRETAATLVRATLASASVLLRETGEEPAELRRQVTSPKGVTHAALQVLMDETTGFPTLTEKAVRAAIARSREFGG